MKRKRLRKLRFFALLFLLPGLAGLIASVTLSTYYMNTLPRYPDPQNLRMIPRNINGYTVYQTRDEDRRLDVLEYPSLGIFLVGLVTGLIYLQKWGLVRAAEAEEDEFLPDEG